MYFPILFQDLFGWTYIFYRNIYTQLQEINVQHIQSLMLFGWLHLETKHLLLYCLADLELQTCSWNGRFFPVKREMWLPHLKLSS